MRDYSFILTLEDALRKEAFRELCKVDLYFLCRWVLNYKDMETLTDLHYSMCDILDKDPFRYLILMFRDSFKTSIAIGKVIQWLIRDPSAQIGVGSDIPDRAIERVRSLKTTLETNVLLQDLFPEVFYKDPQTESDLWRESGLNIRKPPSSNTTGGFRKPSVSAFGLFPLPTGSHYSHVWLDDIENESNTNTEDLVRTLNLRMGAMLPTLHPNAPLFMTGTIYCENGPNTVYQTVWPTYKRPIVDKYGVPTFPSRYGLSEIETKRKEVVATAGEHTWMGQYMLKFVQRTGDHIFPFRDLRLQRCTLVNA